MGRWNTVDYDFSLPNDIQVGDIFKAMIWTLGTPDSIFVKQVWVEVVKTQ